MSKVQGMKIHRGKLFDKYDVIYHEDLLCKGRPCHCTCTVSVGLPSNTIHLYKMWHENADWRRCVTLIEWLENMISEADCGPPSIEDDFAGLQEHAHLLIYTAT